MLTRLDESPGGKIESFGAEMYVRRATVVQECAQLRGCDQGFEWNVLTKARRMMARYLNLRSERLFIHSPLTSRSDRVYRLVQ